MSTFARNPPVPHGAHPPNDAVALSCLPPLLSVIAGPTPIGPEGECAQVGTDRLRACCWRVHITPAIDPPSSTAPIVAVASADQVYCPLPKIWRGTCARLGLARRARRSAELARQ